jgi:HK97 gp10 family phage protein
MATTNVEVDGLKELDATLGLLSLDIQQSIGRAATNAGAQVIKNAAIRNAPSLTGNLKKNIIVKRLTSAQASPLVSQHIVTVREGKLTKKQKGAGLQPAFYGRFIEFGTVKMSPKPFLRPAYDQNKTAAVDAMAARIKVRIDKAQSGS